MADQIRVNYASMASGSDALMSGTNQLRGHADDLLAAANQVAPMWSAKSHVAMQARHANILKNIADIEILMNGHRVALDEHSSSTAQLDQFLTNQFEV